MTGRLHIVDDDNLTGLKIYEELETGLVTGDQRVEVPVLRKYGAVFANLHAAHDFVSTMNARNNPLPEYVQEGILTMPADPWINDSAARLKDASPQIWMQGSGILLSHPKSPSGYVWVRVKS